MSRMEYKFVTPDGRVLDEKDASPEQKLACAQKIMDELFVPLAYEAVLKDLEKERQAAK